MREILFRGKTDKGEWVQGDLSQHKTGKKFIKCGNAIRSYEVIPETVGQFTDLTDKNGKLIFEGDCIGCKYNIVIYCDGTFTINGDRPLSWLKSTSRFVVVGNIHDNQEVRE